MSDMSNNQVVLFLRIKLGKSKWFKIGYEKIWVHLFWKVFTDGKYVGQIENGEPNGQGTFTFPDGEKYVGELKDGEQHGQGTLTSKEGKKFEGEWRNNKPLNGLFYDKDGKINYKYVNGKRDWETSMKPQPS